MKGDQSYISHNNLVHVDYPKYDFALVESVTRFFVQEKYFDLVFICRDNEEVQAHKIVLASVSKFLKDVFCGTGPDVVYVSIPDVDYNIVRILINFLYDGVTSVDCEELKELQNIISVLGIKLNNPKKKKTGPKLGLRNKPKRNSDPNGVKILNWNIQGYESASYENRSNNPETGSNIKVSPFKKPVPTANRKLPPSRSCLTLRSNNENILSESRENEEEKEEEEKDISLETEDDDNQSQMDVDQEENDKVDYVITNPQVSGGSSPKKIKMKISLRSKKKNKKEKKKQNRALKAVAKAKRLLFEQSCQKENIQKKEEMIEELAKLLKVSNEIVASCFRSRRFNDTSVSDNTEEASLSKRGNRTVQRAFTEDQKNVLELAFRSHEYLPSEVQKGLSKCLGVSENSIKYWFTIKASAKEEQEEKNRLDLLQLKRFLKKQSLTKEQEETLEVAFMNNQELTRDVQRNLSQCLTVSERTVRTWFSIRATKKKKDPSATILLSEAPCMPDTSSRRASYVDGEPIVTDDTFATVNEQTHMVQNEFCNVLRNKLHETVRGKTLNASDYRNHEENVCDKVNVTAVQNKDDTDTVSTDPIEKCQLQKVLTQKIQSLTENSNRLSTINFDDYFSSPHETVHRKDVHDGNGATNHAPESNTFSNQYVVPETSTPASIPHQETTSAIAKSKPRQKLIKREHTIIFENLYQKDWCPSDTILQELARNLRLPVKSVRDWFKRRKYKKKTDHLYNGNMLNQDSSEIEANTECHFLSYLGLQKNDTTDVSLQNGERSVAVANNDPIVLGQENLVYQPGVELTNASYRDGFPTIQPDVNTELTTNQSVEHIVNNSDTASVTKPFLPPNVTITASSPAQVQSKIIQYSCNTLPLATPPPSFVPSSKPSFVPPRTPSYAPRQVYTAIQNIRVQNSNVLKEVVNECLDNTVNEYGGDKNHEIIQSPVGEHHNVSTPWTPTIINVESTSVNNHANMPVQWAVGKENASVKFKSPAVINDVSSVPPSAPPTPARSQPIKPCPPAIPISECDFVARPNSVNSSSIQAVSSVLISQQRDLKTDRGTHRQQTTFSADKAFNRSTPMNITEEVANVPVSVEQMNQVARNSVKVKDEPMDHEETLPVLMEPDAV